MERVASLSFNQRVVLGYTKEEAYFAGKPIMDFANSFISPVILVGPDSPEEIHLNQQANLLAERLGLKADNYILIDFATI